MNPPGKYKFKLYTAEGTANSSVAFGNLLLICKTHLPDRYEIEVIDVFREPLRALSDSIRMTPTLVKLAPYPQRTIVGTLSQTQRVLAALGIEEAGTGLSPQGRAAG
jgi:circadian clock protein KaiB